MASRVVGYLWRRPVNGFNQRGTNDDHTYRRYYGVRGIQSDDDNELDNLLSCGDETVTLFSSRKFS